MGKICEIKKESQIGEGGEEGEGAAPTFASRCFQFPGGVATDRAELRANQKLRREIPHGVSHSSDAQSHPAREGWPTLRMSRRVLALQLFARCLEYPECVSQNHSQIARQRGHLI